MSIDPKRLDEQRRVVTDGPRLVPQPGAEYKCPSCRRRTRNAAGRCTLCIRSGAEVEIDLGRYTVEQLVGMVTRIRAEVDRRAKQLEEAKRAVAG